MRNDEGSKESTALSATDSRTPGTPHAALPRPRRPALASETIALIVLGTIFFLISEHYRSDHAGRSRR